MQTIVRLSGALLGIIFGFGLGLLILDRTGDLIAPANRPAFLVAIVVAALLFGYLAIPYVTLYPTRWAVGRLSDAGAGDFVLGVVGLLVGLLMGALIGIPLSQLSAPAGTILPVVISLGLAAIMAGAFMYKREVDPQGLRRLSRPAAVAACPTGSWSTPRPSSTGGSWTSARPGFILGALVAPRFVLDELQRIADSPDAMRRNRGRRGLEMLSALQKDSVTPVEISEASYPELEEVDAKLVALARDTGAAILTNDYNLNRVAELQGIRVLNINELANAVKAVVHPGEEMSVRIIQEGKEPGQGVGYLDDGTMIVVEGGSRFIDQEIPITVTRVLQTVAGRMIFAQPRTES